MTSLRCAPAAQERGDPLHGTAPPANGFVLIEQPGAWGVQAISSARLPEQVLAHVVAACRARGARLLLIRRHRAPESPLRIGVTDSRRGRERIAWSPFDDPRELLECSFEPPEEGPAGELALLTCTHGRRDPCCARRGWPVTQALTAARPEQAWQCSHVGGDRFAANLVVLPHGLYFGHVTPQSALEVADAVEGGELVPDLLRGRSVDAPAVQSALHYAYREREERRIDAIVPAWSRDHGDRYVVGLEHGGEELVVHLRREVSEPIERLTCSGGPSRYERFALVAIEA